jgi:hypothetical protein
MDLQTLAQADNGYLDTARVKPSYVVINYYVDLLIKSGCAAAKNDLSKYIAAGCVSTCRWSHRPHRAKAMGILLCSYADPPPVVLLCTYSVATTHT